MLEMEMPLARAIARELQWVAPFVIVSSVDDHCNYPGIINRAWHARTRLVRKAVKAMRDEPGTPFADGLRRHPELRHHRLIGRTGGTGKHNPRAQRQSLRRRPPARQAPQSIISFGAEMQWHQRTIRHDLLLRG